MFRPASSARSAPVTPFVSPEVRVLNGGEIDGREFYVKPGMSTAIIGIVEETRFRVCEDAMS